jgi:hypothetical protein
MLLNVSHDGVDQLTHALESAPANPLVGDVAKPAFHEVQPRTARRDEVNVEPGMALQPSLDLGVFVRVVVVHDQMQIEIRRRLLIDQLEELDPFLMTMSRHARADQLALGQFQGGKQRRRAMTRVVVRHRAAPALFDRQARLGAVQRLNLTFFIAAQDQRMVGRIEVQPDDIHQFLGEGRIAAELEGSDLERFQVMRLPHAVDQVGANAEVLGQGPNAPVRRVGWRLMDGGLDDPLGPASLLGGPAPAARGILFDAGQAALGETLPPAAHRRGLDRERLGNLFVLLAVGGQEDNLGPLHQPHRCAPSPSPALQGLSLLVGHLDRCSDSHPWRPFPFTGKTHDHES